MNFDRNMSLVCMADFITESCSMVETRISLLLSEEINEVKSNQKALYQIATSVGVIAQRVSNIEQKVDETNRKVDEQNEALKNAELKIDGAVHEPEKRVYDNVNKVKAAFIAAIAAIVAGGVIGAIVAFIK